MTSDHSHVGYSQYRINRQYILGHIKVLIIEDLCSFALPGTLTVAHVSCALSFGSAGGMLGPLLSRA